MSDRPYDVVVYGATGFTGRMVARYFAERDPEPGLRWAIAGRSPEKLARVAGELGGDVPTIVADSADRASLEAMTAQTRAVATTVGPYAKYGAELVAACVATGTHYADLTGEPQFIRQMIDAHHDAAKAAGVRIVNCCGFDSIPSDLGVFNLQQSGIQHHGAPYERVEMIVLGAKGSVSGGTAASAVNLMAEASDKRVRRVLGDPYSLTPGDRGPDDHEQRGARYSEAAQTWTGPFFMASVNEKVVRRSNQQLGFPWGRDFRYGECLRMGTGVRGRLAATALGAASTAAIVGLAIGPVRRLAERRLLPAPGEGPSDEEIEAGYFKFRAFGHAAGGDPQKSGQLLVMGKRDPGYGATACMLAESAICLARNPNLPNAGVLTPASAMGEPLSARLNATDVTFTVEAPAPA